MEFFQNDNWPVALGITLVGLLLLVVYCIAGTACYLYYSKRHYNGTPGVVVFIWRLSDWADKVIGCKAGEAISSVAVTAYILIWPIMLISEILLERLAKRSLLDR